MDIAACQKRISDEFDTHAAEFRLIGDQAQALWDELALQGGELSRCPCLSLVMGKSLEFWSFATHYSSFHLHIGDPPDSTDRHFLKESLRALKGLRLHRGARIAELKELMERARNEVRTASRTS